MKYLLVFGFVCVCIVITIAAPPKEFKDNSKSDESHEHHTDCGHNHHRPHSHLHGHRHGHRHHPHHSHHHKGHRHGHWHKHTNHSAESSEEHQDSGAIETNTTTTIATVNLPSTLTLVFTHSNAGGADNLGTSGLSDFNRADIDVRGINNRPDFNTNTFVSGVDSNPLVGSDNLGTSGTIDFNAVESGVEHNSPTTSGGAAAQPDWNEVSVSGLLPDVQAVVPYTTTESIYDTHFDRDVDVIENIKLNLNNTDPE